MLKHIVTTLPHRIFEFPDLTLVWDGPIHLEELLLHLLIINFEQVLYYFYFLENSCVIKSQSKEEGQVALYRRAGY
jgi:hypothetical protein